MSGETYRVYPFAGPEPIITLTQLAEAIRAVVAYNWADEWQDFKDHPTDEGHIFLALVALDNWANSTSFTAADHIADEEEDT